MSRKSTMRRCFYHTDLVQNAVFHNFSRQIAFIHYSAPSKHAWTLAKPFKKCPKSPIRPAGSNFWQAPNLRRNFKRVTLQRDKEFFINGFITTCNLKKRLMRSAFWVLLQAMFMNAWKQTAKRWKLHFWDYQQSIKKYNSVEHLQRQQFSFTKTNEYLSVPKNPQVFTSKQIKFMF